MYFEDRVNGIYCRWDTGCKRNSGMKGDSRVLDPDIWKHGVATVQDGKEWEWSRMARG